VREAMAAGAVGFASSTSPAHNGDGGLPMPSRLASDEEMLQLTMAMASFAWRLHGHQGRSNAHVFLAIALAKKWQAGDGGGLVAQQHQPPSGVQ